MGGCCLRIIVSHTLARATQCPKKRNGTAVSAAVCTVATIYADSVDRCREAM
eukprot:m.1343 g.1343  ORF g.1343 m.1343 type:complete len:52 (+) comp809_c0_seq1:1191-1346(+)